MISIFRSVRLRRPGASPSVTSVEDEPPGPRLSTARINRSHSTATACCKPPPQALFVAPGWDFPKLGEENPRPLHAKRLPILSLAWRLLAAFFARSLRAASHPRAPCGRAPIPGTYLLGARRRRSGRGRARLASGGDPSLTAARFWERLRSDRLGGLAAPRRDRSLPPTPPPAPRGGGVCEARFFPTGAEDTPGALQRDRGGPCLGGFPSPPDLSGNSGVVGFDGFSGQPRTTCLTVKPGLAVVPPRFRRHDVDERQAG